MSLRTSSICKIIELFFSQFSNFTEPCNLQMDKVEFSGSCSCWDWNPSMPEFQGQVLSGTSHSHDQEFDLPGRQHTVLQTGAGEVKPETVSWGRGSSKYHG